MSAPALPPHLRPALDAYLALLERWNRVHALTALPPEAREEELLLDSAALLPFLAPLPAGARVLDFGSGMGIPAVLLALARPDLEVLALDASWKKTAFLRQAALELGAVNLRALHGRAEALPPLRGDLGVSKATGSPVLLAGWWARHGTPEAPLLLLKGPEAAGEACPPGWTRILHPYRLPTRGARVLVELRH